MKRKLTGKAANPMRARDEKLLQKLAAYLNFHADAVTEADVRALSSEFSLPGAQAFALLLAGALGLDAAENEDDARTVREDFPRMLHPLDAAAYADDPYARALRAAASREQSLPDNPTDPAAHSHASRAALSREDISQTLHPRCAAADAGAPRESNADERRSASWTLLPQNAAAGTDAPRESSADERRSASCTLLPQNAAADTDAPRESNADERRSASCTLLPQNAAADTDAPRESNADERRSASCTLLPQNAAADTDAPRESNADERRSALCTLLPQNAAADAGAPRESNADERRSASWTLLPQNAAAGADAPRESSADERRSASWTLLPQNAAAGTDAPREPSAGERRSSSCTLLPQNAAAGADAPRESSADERRSASWTLLPQNAAADAGAPRESNADGHEDASRTRRSRNTLGRENASQAGAFELGYASYRPYELFVADDLRAYPDGAVLPVLGYFTRPFAYPVLTENGREWMTATPNEINTIRPMAEAAHGHVLTLGLGLGYFAFHALLNPRVERVTAVERSADAIRLFRERILPAFPRPERLTILQADAFAAAPALYQSGQYDFVFADLWHDAADGLPMYERLKKMEVPGPEYRYWIEKTLEFYR